MGATSAIEWTEATWSPLVGCTKVSPGCENCYAETQVNTRFHPAALAKGGKHLEAFPTPFETVSIRPDRFLTLPLHWRRPRRIFVNSLSDLFHADVPDEFIARVFAVMAVAPQHTFQLLTKRHARMRSLLSDPGFSVLLWAELADLAADMDPGNPSIEFDVPWPLPNVWLGVSVENQQWADIRIPALLDTPAAIRWLSCEPLLGPVDISACLTGDCPTCGDDITTAACGDTHARMALDDSAAGIDWVVVGGESGPGARPMHPDWARSIRDQCVTVGVPYLFKQWGNWAPVVDGDARSPDHWVLPDGQHKELAAVYGAAAVPNGSVLMRNVGKKAAGRQLDGREWLEYPAAGS